MRFLSAVNPLVWALLIGAVLALTLILYFSSFARALAPKRGTLEWIAMYDRPGLCLSGSGGAFRWKELPLCLLAAVLSAGLYLLAVCLQLRSFILFSVPMGRLMLFGGAGLFALSAAGCFALTRSLYGSLPAAFCCAMLLGLEYAAEYVAVLGWCGCCSSSTAGCARTLTRLRRTASAIWPRRRPAPCWASAWCRR